MVLQQFLTSNNKRLVETQVETLAQKSQDIESGIKNGLFEASNLDELKAEMISLKQSIIELDAAHESTLKILSILTGHEINATDKLMNYDPDITPDNLLKTP